MNICDDNDKIDYDIELTLTRSSFSTLSLTSNHPGPFKADKSFFTVVFWELPLSHSLIMDNITFLRARSDQPRSSRASSDLSLATLTKSLFSFLANFWLSLWIMLLLQISSQTSSQFSNDVQGILSISSSRPPPVRQEQPILSISLLSILHTSVILLLLLLHLHQIHIWELLPFLQVSYIHMFSKLSF